MNIFYMVILILIFGMIIEHMAMSREILELLENIQ